MLLAAVKAAWNSPALVSKSPDLTLTLTLAQIVEYYGVRWKIEAGFREIKQEIGSAETQTRHPDAVANHLHFCMAATTITWLYGAHLHQAPPRRYATGNAPSTPSPICVAPPPRISAARVSVAIAAFPATPREIR